LPSTEAPTVQLYACRGRLVAVPSLIVQRKPGSQSRQASPVFSGARPLVQMRPSKKCNVYVTGGDYNDGACGPSDECGAVECDGAGDGSCNAGHVCGNSVVVKGRATFVNNSCGTEFFWYECCPNGGFKCTDCCGCKYHPGATCEQEGGTSSCVAPHPHYKCICEKKTTDTCQVG